MLFTVSYDWLLNDGGDSGTGEVGKPWDVTVFFVIDGTLELGVILHLVEV